MSTNIKPPQMHWSGIPISTDRKQGNIIDKGWHIDHPVKLKIKLKIQLYKVHFVYNKALIRFRTNEFNLFCENFWQLCFLTLNGEDCAVDLCAYEF